MRDQVPILNADRRLIAALGARGGRGSPAELREATGLPGRTLTRTLGRLDSGGLLAERSKRIVTLSARGWLLLEPPSRPGAELSAAERGNTHPPTQRGNTYPPTVFRARAGSRELASESPVGATYAHFELDHEDRLDGDQPTCEDECEISHATDPGGGFWTGFLEGLRGTA